MAIKSILTILIFIAIANSCTNPEQIEIDISQGWKFKTGDNTDWANPDFDDSGWKNINASVYWERQGYAGYDGYAWYRVSFYLPSAMKIRAYLKDTLQIVLGKIDGTDQAFLNGELIGQNGIS